MVRGSQVPRVRVVPDGVDHPRLSEVAKFVERMGVDLDEWQWDVLRVSLMRTRDLARWAAFTVAVCAPRQNGKNGILEVRELVGAALLGEKLVIHTAHLADTSKEGFRRLDDLIDANPWLAGQVDHIWRTNGHESIEFKNGNRIRFRTRTRGGGRGFSGSPVIFDEPMFLAEISMGSILPVMSAQPDPQAWYTGSAVDQAIHEDGVVFARVRERALGGDHERLAYWEWSLPYETPDEVPDDMDVLAAAADTNPAFGVRIMPDYIEAEQRELDARTLAVERFGVGDWPPTDGSAYQVIRLADWDALEDDPASSSARMLDPVALAFDTTPDRSMSSVVAAGLRDDEFVQVEMTDHRAGTAWVAPRVAELVDRHQPVWVGCDASGPAGSLLPELERAGVDVEVVSAADHAKACGFMFDTVEERGLRHLGGQPLRSAVKGATKRPLGDAWAWSRRNSSVDISPLVAATLAVWGHSINAPSGDIHIVF